jgi:hypothetical protein
LKEKGDEKAELEDDEWLFDLIFLADITGKLSDVSLELQGKNKYIADEYNFILRKQIRVNDD